MLILFSLYVVYLDFVVRDRFDDVSWQLPAKVYARPLELYEGLKLNATQFEQELNLLNYRYAYQPTESGTFQRNGDAFDIVTRGFTFWDIDEPSQRIRVSFSSEDISEIINTRSRDTVSLLRLDPVLIGGIYPLQKEDREIISLDDVPELLPDILIAIEDRKFYQHFGVDPWAVGRAVLANLRAGKPVQGGSTITQQLVKNFFLSNERTLWRKFNEVIMAVLLDMHYEKKEILQAYINEVYLGQDKSTAVHGFGRASRFYFDKPIQQLDLNQMAILVAMIRGPSYYHPENHPQRLLARRNRILDLLLEQKVISPALHARTSTEPVVVNKKRYIVGKPHPAFLDLVKRQLREYYPESRLQSEGLRIFTTLDPILQRHAEQVLEQRVNKLDAAKKLDNKLQAAAVFVNATSAEVQALVSDRNPQYAGFNRALDAQRPIGSLIKPIVYLAALQQRDRYTWSSLIADKPISLKTGDNQIWSPGNYDDISHGDVTLITALIKSYNQAAVRLGLDVGFPAINDVYRKLGGKHDMPAYPSVLLGAHSMSPLEVTQIYQTLAANGFHSQIRSIREVLDAQGQPLTRYPIKVKQSLSSEYVSLLVSGLRQVTKVGTASTLSERLPNIELAGKTGTTNDKRDSWFAGFSGSHVGVVWLGTDDNQPIGLSGSSGALPLWAEIVSNVSMKSLQIEQSEQLEAQWIEASTGLLTNESCGDSMQLLYIKGTAPTQYSSECQPTGVRKQIQKTVEWFKRIFQ